MTASNKFYNDNNEVEENFASQKKHAKTGTMFLQHKGNDWLLTKLR